MASWLILAFALFVSTYSGSQATDTDFATAGEYRTAHDKFIEGIIKQNDPLSDVETIAGALRLRLWKWYFEGADSFKQYHKAMYGVTEFQDIYDSYIDHNRDLLLSVLNHFDYATAAQYFKANPSALKYFFFDRFILLKDLENVQIHRTAGYNFTQEVFSYSNQPSLEQKTEHYRMRANYTDSDVENLKDLSNSRDSSFYRKVYAETLDQTQAAVLDFRMNLIKYSYASLLVGQSGVDKVADILPSMANIQNTTRIYNPSLKKCLAMAFRGRREDGSIYVSIEMKYCDSENYEFDWHLIEYGGNFLLKHIKFGYCLVGGHRGLNYGLCSEQATKSRAPNSRFFWILNPNNLTTIRNYATKRVIDSYEDFKTTVDQEMDRPSLASDAQLFTFSAPYFNSAVVTANYYRDSNPKEFIRNWPKMLKAYMFKQYHNVSFSEWAIKDFFNGVKKLSYFDKLPEAIKDICNSVAEPNGKTIFGALEYRLSWNGEKVKWSDDYTEMKKSLDFDSKDNGEFELINGLNDMYLRAGLNTIFIQANSSLYLEKGEKYDPPLTFAYLPIYGMNSETSLKADRKSDKAVDMLVNDAQSIAKGLSVFNVAALPARRPASTAGDLEAFKAFGEVFGLSRSDVETIPMTGLCENTAVVEAFNKVQVFAQVRVNNEIVSLPTVNATKVSIM